MTTKFISLLGAMLLMVGCQVSGSSSSSNAQIDWVNFIQVGSTQYAAGMDAANVLQDSDLGPVYAHVKFKVSGNICDPSYQLRDRDAAFLDPGRPIFRVNGHAPGEELTAHFNGSIVAHLSKTS